MSPPWCAQMVLNDFQRTLVMAKSKEAASLPRQMTKTTIPLVERQGLVESDHVSEEQALLQACNPLPLCLQ